MDSKKYHLQEIHMLHFDFNGFLLNPILDKMFFS